MAGTNDSAAEFYFCEVADCGERGEPVIGSPVIRFACRPHARDLGLELDSEWTPRPVPKRTMPLPLLVGEIDRCEVRAVSLDPIIVAVEDALGRENAAAQLEAVRGLLAALREARELPLEQLAAVVAPGF